MAKENKIKKESSANASPNNKWGLFRVLSAGTVLAGAVLLANNGVWNSNVRYPRAALQKKAVSAPPAIPQMPSAYPDADENLFITGTYLNDPIVLNALAYVNSVVSSSLLNLSTSTYIQYSDVTYHADPIANCYWPNNLCLRNTTGQWGNPDIVYCPNNYTWGLTYDDAPSENFVNGVHQNDTIALMNQLDSMNIKATFFVTGSQSVYYPVSLKAIATRSHHVGHHSWSHHPFTTLTNAQIVAEMMYTAAIIYNNTGLNPRYFRPPYGDIDDRVRAIVNALGYRVIMWDGTYDSTDADVTANAKEFGIVEGIIQSWFNTVPGFIALQHTISTFTSGIGIDILKKIVAMGGIKNQMMPVPQCLGDNQWYKNSNVSVTSIVPSSTTTTTKKTASASPTTSPSKSSSSLSSAGTRTTVSLWMSVGLLLLIMI